MEKINLSKIQKGLAELSKSYWESIPMNLIASVVEINGSEILQEDGTHWEGFLCGQTGSASIDLKGVKNKKLRVQWYKMGSGRYELNAYVS